MSEEQSLPPAEAGQQGQFSFDIAGQKFGFGGELAGGEFTGNIDGPDGKTFLGFAKDLGGGRWLVENFESGSSFQSPEAAAAPPAEAAPIGLADAAAVAALEAAEPVRVAEPAAPVVEVAEPVAELQPKVAEAVALPSVAEVTAPPAESSSSAPEFPVTLEISAKHPLVNQSLTEVREAHDEAAPQAEEARRILSAGQKADRLMAEAERLRNSINRLRKTEKIIEAIETEGRLKNEAKALRESVAGKPDFDEYKVRKLETRRDSAKMLETELSHWDDVMQDRSSFDRLRQLVGERQTQRRQAEEIFSQAGASASDKSKELLRQTIDSIDQKFAPQLAGLAGKMPMRLLELVGYSQSGLAFGVETPGTAGDEDLWQKYYQTADQLYAELTGQPAPVLEPTPVPAPVPVAPAEVEVPEQPQPLVPVEEPPVGEGAVPAPEAPAEAPMPVLEPEQQAKVVTGPAETVAPGQPTEVELPEEVAETAPTAPAPMPEQQPEPTPAAPAETPLPEQAAEPPAETTIGGYRPGGQGVYRENKFIGEIIGPDGQTFVGIVRKESDGTVKVIKGLAEGLESQVAETAAPAQAPLPAAPVPTSEKRPEDEELPDVPTWLRGFHRAEGAPAESPSAAAPAAAAEEEIPDWLKSPGWLSGLPPAATAPAPGAEMPVQDSELPDWMSGIPSGEAPLPVPARLAEAPAKRAAQAEAAAPGPAGESEAQIRAHAELFDQNRARLLEARRELDSAMAAEDTGRAVDATADLLANGFELSQEGRPADEAARAALEPIGRPELTPLAVAGGKRLLKREGILNADGTPNQGVIRFRRHETVTGLLEFLFAIIGAGFESTVQSVISQLPGAEVQGR